MEASSRIHPAIRGQSAATRASRLAEKQFGPIARRQLLELGLPSSRIERWVAAGRLHPRYPGVYAYGRRDLPPEGHLAAALLLAGRGAALGGITALWWLELLERLPVRVHVDAPGRVASQADVLVRHPRDVRRVWVRGLPLVLLPNALLAATPDLSHNSLRLVLARAEFRHLLDLGALHAALGPGRPGTTSLRAAMAAHLPQLAACESQLEIDFVLLCERFGIELPEPNVRIGRWRPDMLWRNCSLIVELDGRDAHSTAAQLASDRTREIALQRLGFTVVRFGWADVHHRAAWVVAEVRRLLAAG